MLFTEVKGVAGFVKPGDHVDILGTFELGHDGGQTSRKTRTVLQDVRVLASAQTMTNNLMTENTSNNTPVAKKSSGLGMSLPALCHYRNPSVDAGAGTNNRIN